MIMISHNMAVIQHACDRVAVMYLGQLVEMADADEIVIAPCHPYTEALVSAVPVPDPHAKRGRIILKGDVLSPVDPPAGCRFTRVARTPRRCAPRSRRGCEKSARAILRLAISPSRSTAPRDTARGMAFAYASIT